MRQTSVARLYDLHREQLELTHVSGRLDRVISVNEERIWPADLVGHLNLIHPTRIQILGAAELAWAGRHSSDKVAHHLTEIIGARPRPSSSPTAARSPSCCAASANTPTSR